MITTTRTSSDNEAFISLVKQLDTYLAFIDGDDHPFYAQYNKTDSLKQVIVASIEDQTVGCGAIREFAPGIMEVKRMFTLPAYRGQGVASVILFSLEGWARELGYEKCVLETSKKQTEAIALYKKSGYRIIENYGQYAEMENSVCFEKALN